MLPKKIKIGPIIYDVIIADKMNGNFAGEIDYYNCTITILKSNLQHMRMTLWHEVLHGMFYNLGHE